MRLARALATIASCVLGVTVAIGACSPPTQMTIEVRTRMRCAELASGVSLAVGSTPESTEQKLSSRFPTASTNDCVESGLIGTLVVTPGSSSAAVVVVAGTSGRPTSECTRENAYKDCIVARRSFAFVEHKRLTLPIELTADCVNVPCGLDTTCVGGVCVGAHVECSDDGCGAIGSADGGVGATDAGDSSVVADAADAADDAADSSLPPPDGGLTSDLECGVTLRGAMAYRTLNGARYCVDRTEVTQAAYADYLASVHPPKSPGCTKGELAPSTSALGPPACNATSFTPQGTPNRPVVCVDRCDATSFCLASGKSLCTIPQWTDTCKSGITANLYPYGAAYSAGACNGVDRATGHTVDVGTLNECSSSAAGTSVLDMSGNAWEWTSPNAVRGGGFTSPSAQLGCALINGPTSDLSSEIGFRCCKLL